MALRRGERMGPSLSRDVYDLRMPFVPNCNHQKTQDDKRFGPWHEGRTANLPGEMVLVMPYTPIVWRRAVYRIAQFFRREFEYDFTQYGYEGKETEDAPAFLWTRGECEGEGWQDTVFGACCFRWREWTNAPHGWGLQWIWLHPYERRHGHLSKAWPYFKDVFGDFVVEGPISLPMRQFLSKMDYAHPI